MTADYFDCGLDGPALTSPTAWEEIADALERSTAAHRARLEQELIQIEDQLTARDQLHHDLVTELEQQIDRYVARLEHLYTISRGRLDGTRQQLKDRLVTFYRELRDEHRAHWRDCQRLEDERRTVQRELAETADDSLIDLFG